MYKYKDFKEMTDQELVDASFNVEAILAKGLEARNKPKYKKKFVNQPPPNINPALIELRDNLANEFKERQKKEKQNEPEA
jgi:hypothetical protein